VHHHLVPSEEQKEKQQIGEKKMNKKVFILALLMFSLVPLAFLFPLAFAINPPFIDTYTGPNEYDPNAGTWVPTDTPLPYHEYMFAVISLTSWPYAEEMPIYTTFDWGDGSAPVTVETRTAWVYFAFLWGDYDPAIATHTWTSYGVYDVTVTVVDYYGESVQGVIATVVLESPPPPPPPNLPNLAGVYSSSLEYVSTCYAGYEYFFRATSEVPYGDEVWHEFDWGDGTYTMTSEPTTYESIASHIWGSQGTYTVRVRAQNLGYVWGDWSDPLTFTVDSTPPPPPPEHTLEFHTIDQYNVEASAGYVYIDGMCMGTTEYAYSVTEGTHEVYVDIVPYFGDFVCYYYDGICDYNHIPIYLTVTADDSVTVYYNALW
jgi:hypothetical protein